MFSSLSFKYFLQFFFTDEHIIVIFYLEFRSLCQQLRGEGKGCDAARVLTVDVGLSLSICGEADIGVLQDVVLKSRTGNSPRINSSA